MSLILAVQPDRREAAKVVAIARGSLGAEIVVTESAEEAIASLKKRVPDLVLISQLLSPKDDQAIGDKLRELDTAGTSVQTLVIPMLGGPGRRSKSKQAGLLGRLRKSRASDATPEGCDPDVFAAQISEYLERAVADCEAAKAAALDSADQHHAGSREPAEVDPLEALVAAPVETTAAHHLETIAAPPVEFDAVMPTDLGAALLDGEADLPDVPIRVDPVDVEENEKIHALGTVDLLDDAELLAELAITVEEPVEIEEPEQIGPAADETDWQDVEFGLSDSDALVLTSETIDIEAFIRDLEAPPAPPPVPRLAEAPASPRRTEKGEPPVWGRTSWPRMEGEAVADLAREVDLELAADPELAEFAAALYRMPEPPAQDAPEEPVSEIPEGAEQELDELWTPLAAHPDYVWPRMESASVPARAPAPATAPNRPKAAQDEWGFFDPDQCGIPAVMKRVSLIEAQEPRR